VRPPLDVALLLCCRRFVCLFACVRGVDALPCLPDLCFSLGCLNVVFRCRAPIFTRFLQGGFGVGGGGGRAYPDLIRGVGSEVFLLRVSPPQCARLARRVRCFVCVIAY